VAGGGGKKVCLLLTFGLGESDRPLLHACIKVTILKFFKMHICKIQLTIKQETLKPLTVIMQKNRA